MSDLIIKGLEYCGYVVGAAATIVIGTYALYYIAYMLQRAKLKADIDVVRELKKDNKTI